MFTILSLCSLGIAITSISFVFPLGIAACSAFAISGACATTNTVSVLFAVSAISTILFLAATYIFGKKAISNFKTVDDKFHDSSGPSTKFLKSDIINDNLLSQRANLNERAENHSYNERKT
jgi:cytochrome b subunit of formate dehydrogenase